MTYRMNEDLMRKTDSYRRSFLNGIGETFLDNDTYSMAREIALNIPENINVDGIKVDGKEINNKNMEYIKSISQKVIKNARKKGFHIPREYMHINRQFDGKISEGEILLEKVHEYLTDKFHAHVTALTNDIQIVMGIIKVIVRTTDLTIDDFVDTINRMSKYREHIDGLK